MSFIPKLGTVVRVALVVVSIGATSLKAQTQVENSSNTNVGTAASTDTTKALDSKKAAVTTTVETMLVTASIATAKSTSSPETAVPQTVAADKWQFQVSPYFWLAGLH
ncbi:MAG TPA: hypothetical protein VIR01_14075, partial [Pyrinomonadaceae bacterium]